MHKQYYIVQTILYNNAGATTCCAVGALPAAKVPAGAAFAGKCGGGAAHSLAMGYACVAKD